MPLSVKHFVVLPAVNGLTEGQPRLTNLQVHVDIGGEADVIVGKSGVSQQHILVIAVPDT